MSGVKVQSIVFNCKVRQDIINDSEIKIQTDGKRNYEIGDKITRSTAKNILHKSNVEQTQAETTNTTSIDGGRSNSKAKVIIGHHISDSDVAEDVTNQDTIIFESDDIIIGDNHDDVRAENIKFEHKITQK